MQLPRFRIHKKLQCATLTPGKLGKSMHQVGGRMVPIYEPKNESEAAVIGAMMEAYGIRHFFQGEAFGQLLPGAVSTSLNARILMVDSSQVELAQELLANFLDAQA